MGIEIVGLREKIDAIGKVVRDMQLGVERELMSSGEKMAAAARADHNFTSGSGRLEGDIKFDVPKGSMSMTFGISNDSTKSNWKRAPHVSYGTFQHEGTKEGYLKSAAAGAHKPSPGCGGIKADHFIVRAWEKHIKGMKERVVEIVFKHVREAIGA